MNNINKILITVVVCVLIICVATVSIVKIVSDSKVEPTVSNTAIGGDTSSLTGVPYPVTPSGSDDYMAPTPSTEPTSNFLPGVTFDSGTTTPSGDTSPSAPVNPGELSQALLGKWMDSAGMSGYEFLEGGKLNMTYVDLSPFGFDFQGATAGLYTLEGDMLTIKYSIYTATIQKSYRISISQNELSMYDTEERETSTYVRVA